MNATNFSNEERASFLNKVISGEWTLAQLKINANEMKVRKRFRVAFCKYTTPPCDTWEEAIDRFVLLSYIFFFLFLMKMIEIFLSFLWLDTPRSARLRTSASGPKISKRGRRPIAPQDSKSGSSKWPQSVIQRSWRHLFPSSSKLLPSMSFTGDSLLATSWPSLASSLPSDYYCTFVIFCSAKQLSGFIEVIEKIGYKWDELIWCKNYQAPKSKAVSFISKDESVEEKEDK